MTSPSTTCSGNIAFSCPRLAALGPQSFPESDARIFESAISSILLSSIFSVGTNTLSSSLFRFSTRFRSSSDISEAKRRHFISAFFIDLIQKCQIKGRVTELINKDLDDDQLASLDEVTIDKEKIGFIISKLDEFMEGYGMIQGEKEVKEAKDDPSITGEAK